MIKDKCLCRPTEVFIFPFSGGSNVGQIANEAAKQLTNQCTGRMYCLAGIGGHISGIVESTRAAKKIVAIDGCPVICARKALEHAGFKVDEHAIVTELGITTDSGFTIKDTDVQKVVETLQKVNK